MALKHPRFGLACKRIRDDIRDGKLKTYYSLLVPIEILGSLARVDREIAAGAILAFFSFPIEMIPIDERLIREASEIMLETGVSYDSIHAAAMRRRGLKTVITEDVEHWKKITGINIITPSTTKRPRDKKPTHAQCWKRTHCMEWHTRSLKG